nr:hypothetical protein BaRGS_026733 [Batillaria attramentaria]
MMMVMMMITVFIVCERQGSEYSPFLHDVVYLYLLVLNETISEGLDHRDGQLLFNKATGRTFKGVTGNVKLDSNGDRLPDYWVWSMAAGEDVFSHGMEARMTSNGPQKIFLTRAVTWATPDGKPPPDTPACGFLGENCPPNNSERTMAVVIAVIVFAGVSAFGAGCFIYWRRAQLEKTLQQMLWKVEYEEIKFTKSNCSGSISQMSLHSLSSGLSGLRSRGSGSALGEGQLFSSVGVYRGQFVAVKRISRTKLTIGRSQQLHLKNMKELNHENLVMFVGLCVDDRFPCILTAYCTKGSLQDIVENDDIKLDWTFKNSLITDLVNGMNYLHGCPIRYHGSLKSSNCLVDNRWVLKVADFGLQGFYKFSEHHQTDYQRYRGLLWTAPEVLRCTSGVTQMPEAELQKADVYSFGIVLYEIISRSSPYDTETMAPEEIIRRINAGENPPLRPNNAGGRAAQKVTWPGDVPETVVKLMSACWSECVLERPSFPGIKCILAALNKGRKQGIVDNMLMMLEKYANNLEDIVEQRTLELVVERKKSDMLLYRMLPKVVAEKLKAGTVVPPEMYEAVTIYFSDIVGFTSLASDSSPMEIVDLLNDLYSKFDSIIALHNVYKIETIGDAYMVVSGLPVRNGDSHVSEVANMALDLLSSVTCFRIRHRPDTQLSLRIGIHTGPCAAGVVGLTMPRYCLFGDTVNMASRMESTGQPLKIQVSEVTKSYLDVIGGYHFTYRGTVEVKGKGQQTTYWLQGRDGFAKCLPGSVV